MAYSGGTATYNLNSFLPDQWRGWDEYSHRLNRYEVLDGYYHNVAYHSFINYSDTLKLTERLYKHVRGVYNQAYRSVEVYPAKVYGGALDTDGAHGGAIPIVTDNEALRDAIITLWRNSNWGQKKSLYVRNGAKYGDTFLKVVDDVHRGIVYLEPVDPRKIKHIECTPDGMITRVEIEYYTFQANTRIYKEVITPETISVTLDGEPVPLYTNLRGERVSEWPNEYGFVPMVHVPHRDVGMVYGGNVFYTSMHKINELNDLASILNDGARRQVRMPIVTRGRMINNKNAPVQSETTGQATPQKDAQAILQMEADGDAKTLPPVISIADTMQAVMEILAEIERDLPELSLHRLRDSTNQTAPGVRAAYDDAIAKIQEARGNYDTALVRAQSMAVAMAGMRGYEGFEGFGLGSLTDGATEHNIAARPVIGDTVGRERKVELTLAALSSAAPARVYVELGYTQDEAEDLAASPSVMRPQAANSGLQRLAELGRNVRSTRQAFTEDESP